MPNRLLARTSHRCSSRGCRGAVPSGVFDPRGAEAYLTVRRAPRGEKTSLGGVHLRPQQETGEMCGLAPSPLDQSPQAVRIGSSEPSVHTFRSAYLN